MTTGNSDSHNRINVPSQDTTALKRIVVLSGIHRLVVTNIQRFDLALWNHHRSQSGTLE